MTTPTYPHRIRLRGPWEWQTATEQGRLTLPGALGQRVAGGVRYRRHFGYPGRIDADERVWLVVERPAQALAVTLNGVAVGECDVSAEWDVTGRLSARNELAIDTQASAGEAWGEVGIEVRRTAFLRELRVSAEGRVVTVTGVVVGHAEGPLDLYVVADRRTAAYLSVSTSEMGTPFAASGEAEGAPEWVKVELVQGATAWYTAEIDLAAHRRREEG